MVPNFALSLSFDGITLLHRETGGWVPLLDVALDTPDLEGSLRSLRVRALKEAPDGTQVTLILPNEQIRYLDLDAPADPDRTDEAVRAALDGATPYAVSELVFDWELQGNTLHVAAVARETLTEAESFLRTHGFDPVSFAAIPSDTGFSRAVSFGAVPGWTGPDPATLDAQPQAEDTDPQPEAPDSETPIAGAAPSDAAHAAIAEALSPSGDVSPEEPADAVADQAADDRDAQRPAAPQDAMPARDDVQPEARLPDPKPATTPQALPRETPSEAAAAAKDSAPKQSSEEETQAQPAPDAAQDNARPAQSDSLPPSPTVAPDATELPLFAQDTTPRTGRDREQTLPLATGAESDDETKDPAPLTEAATDAVSPGSDEVEALRPGVAESINGAADTDTDALPYDAAATPEDSGKTPPTGAKPAKAPLRADAPMESRAIPPAPSLSMPAPGASAGVPAAKPLGAAATDAPASIGFTSIRATRDLPDAPASGASLQAIAEPPPTLAAKSKLRFTPQLRAEDNGPETAAAPKAAPAKTAGGKAGAKSSSKGLGFFSRRKSGSADETAKATSGPGDAKAAPPAKAKVGRKKRTKGSAPSAPVAVAPSPAAPSPVAPPPTIQKVTARPRPDPAAPMAPMDTVEPLSPAPLPATSASEAVPHSAASAPAAAATPPVAQRIRAMGKARTDPKTKDQTKIANAVDLDEERRRMTVFGARGNEQIGGKPRFLGLMLTAGLLLFLAGVAAWASVFMDEGLSRFFGPRDDNPTAVAALPDPEESLAPAPPAQEGPAPASEQIAALPTVEEPTAQPDPAPRTRPAVQQMSAESAAATYAATGIWQRAPSAPDEPPQTSTEDIYVASIDPSVRQFDAVALPEFAPLRKDAALQPVALPWGPDVRFDLDDQGLVRARPEGAISPDGVRIFTGRPPVVPPRRVVPEQEAPAAAPDAAAIDGSVPDNLSDASTQSGAGTDAAALRETRPAPRPEDLVEQSERATLGGISVAELGSRRPLPRPDAIERRAENALESDIAASTSGLGEDIAEALAEAVPPAEADPEPVATGTAQAVAVSLIPKPRPGNMATIVRRAEPQVDVQTASAGPIRIQPGPRVPQNTNVAREATTKNQINLRKISLIGVYGKESSRRALLRLPTGRYQKVKVGDRVDGGRVAAIGDGELRYTKGGRNIVLEMPRG